MLVKPGKVKLILGNICKAYGDQGVGKCGFARIVCTIEGGQEQGVIIG